MRQVGSLKYVFVFLVLAITGSPVPSWATTPNNKPLVMGVFPIVSSVALFKRFAPLKDYLAQHLGRELVLETARNFPTFVQRTAKRRYDIVITAPHFSLLAADSGDYQIIARPERDLVSLIVVHKNSKITRLSQLAGKIIATPPVPSLSTRSGKDYLVTQGLTGAKSPIYHAYKSHNAAYQSALTNDASAALVSINAVNKALEKGIPLRIIGKLPPLPAMAMLVAINQGKQLAADIEKILVDMKKTSTGRQTLKKVGFPGYISSRVKDYLPVRPYKPANVMIGALPK